MENSENHNAAGFWSVVNAVRKAIGQNTANAVVSNTKEQGLFRCKGNTAVNLGDELNTQVEPP